MKQIKLGILLASTILLFVNSANAEEVISPASDVVYQDSGIDDEQEIFPCAGAEKVLQTDEDKMDLLIQIASLENEKADLEKENKQLQEENEELKK